VAVVTARSILEIIRDLNAEARAKRQYAKAAAEWFELEDDMRALRFPERVIAEAHRTGLIAGRAVFFADVDPQPPGLP